MRRHVLLFGVVAGALIALLRVIEYRYLVIERSVEIYGALVAVLFAGIGIWLGRKITRPRDRIVVHEVPVEVRVPPGSPFTRDDRRVAELGLTPREVEILERIAEGLSTREIAERSYISENTVKTHSSRVFDKLGVRRRVQAVQRARDLGLIP